MSGLDICPPVANLVNEFRFVDRQIFDQTFAETEIQFKIAIGNGTMHFGMREGAPLALFDIPGVDLLPILAPYSD